MADFDRAISDLRQELEVTRQELFGQPATYSVSARRYFEHYGFEIPNRSHGFGTFDEGNHRLAAHVFLPVSLPETVSLPRTVRGTVVVLHGYLDHAGIQIKLARRLLDEGFAVALFDLPGHGLSTGERASIDDFEEYLDSLRAFLALCRQHLPEPFHLIGHSTGGAVIADHLLADRPVGVGRVVLLAPLVQPYGWRLSSWGQRLTGVFLDRVPRVFRSNSSDQEFLNFVRGDPLQPKHIPFAWQRALQAWQKRLAAYPPNEKQILILRGTHDTTVDGRYNEAFLKDKFPRARVRVLRGARHHLTNEAAALREKVFEMVSSELGNSMQY